MMTTLGLNYLNYKELQRSNLIKEAETMRSNLENEARQRSALEETIRTNKEGEAIKRETLAETGRTNRENESIKWQTLGEQHRSNLVDEAEKHRANIEDESRKRAELAETIRYNEARERLQAEAQAETHRTNVEGEAIKRDTLSETITKDRNAEQIAALEHGLKAEDLAELIRYHNETLQLNRDQLEQTAWNNYSKLLAQVADDSNIPAMKIALQLAATGAATSGVRNTTGVSVVDEAISTIKDELLHATTPDDDPEERRHMKRTLDGIDNNVRGYTAKVMGGIADALQYLSHNVEEREFTGNAAQLIGTIFQLMEKGLSGDSGAGVGDLFQKYGDQLKKAIMEGVLSELDPLNVRDWVSTVWSWLKESRK